MNVLIIVFTSLICAGVIWFRPVHGPGALLICALVSLPTLLVLMRAGEERTFLLRLFVLAVVVRIMLATVIHIGGMEAFFGGDATTYDIFGKSLMQSWHGDEYHTARYAGFIRSGAGAWGMLYVVAGVYQLVGENRFAVQLLNAAVGGSTAIVVYYTAQSLFSNVRVSRVAAVLVAFFPSLILWSSQALKDGLIILALALAILATLRLMEKITVRYVLVLTGCLLALLSLRFYIFYMMVAAVAGSFILGMKTLNVQTFVQRFVAVALMGLAFTWFGVLRYAGTQFERYANLKAIQMSRIDQTSAGSGFGKDVDVGTTEGALTAIPVGLVYLLFAPFPWDMATVRQSITLPEMLIWWTAFPLLVLGLWFALRHRLRQVAPIVIFTTMLTLAYSLFQGNVGTAYRQRSQLLVFYFIFVAVGAVLLKERAEDKRRQQQQAKQELADLQAARVLARRQTIHPQT
ncbi:MAG TPA: glycosyltransferase family 39 protein [Pyrinomonadaceae bacterium]|jgi:4-amino-4-deoxy-L-arabinose transferase-like glycosyltransferase|nr:glycosyltransferase family 39 protein [Pyrinomonadaceae bacterium]